MFRVIIGYTMVTEWLDVIILYHILTATKIKPFLFFVIGPIAFRQPIAYKQTYYNSLKFSY